MSAEKQKRSSHIHRTRSDLIFDIVIFIVLTLIFISVAYPLYFVIISSISSPKAVASGMVVWRPIGITFDGYKEVFKDDRVIRGFINSLIYTIVGTSVNLLLTLPTAYALSRSDFAGNRIVMIFYMITMFISGGLMPTYLIVKNVGLLDSMWSLILPGAIGVYNMIVARTFFKANLPAELLEAAKIDGCGNTRFFFKIALPLSSAIIAILVLQYGIGHWNSYFSAMLYLSDKNKYPLQLILRSILILNESQLSQSVLSSEQKLEMERLRQVGELMKYSLIIVSSIPVMILYPFIQKHFVKGVMIGSVKG